MNNLLLLAVVIFFMLGYSVHRSGGGSGGGIAGLAKTCKTIENPADGEDFEGLFGHFFQDTTVISVWCRPQGGTDVDLHLYDNDNGTPTTITTGADIACVNASQAGFTDNFTDLTIDAGNEIGLVITDVDGAVTTIEICVEFE